MRARHSVLLFGQHDLDFCPTPRRAAALCQCVGDDLRDDLLFVINLIRQNALIIEPTIQYVGSLVYLAVGASVLAFASYLTLLRRLGAGAGRLHHRSVPHCGFGRIHCRRGLSWTLLAVLGVMLAIIGNVLVLRRPSPKP